MTMNTSAESAGKILSARGISPGWLLALGVLMTVLGVIGLGMSYWLTTVAIFWLGILAIVGGVAQILDAFHHREWKGIVWHLIIGAVYIAAGFLMITTPLSSAFWLTLFLAISLVVTGISRIFLSLQMRGQSGAWLWVLLSGVISIALGAIIYGAVAPPGAEALATPEGQLQWVSNWGGFIGLFVAVEFIMEGLSLISIASTAKRAGYGA
ncbi:MAG: DUF308 domain-containing protein [Hyphomicrobiales bacterium]|nr:DUF308 domain-containing protein [Hyphomicrobiales bacterium]